MTAALEVLVCGVRVRLCKTFWFVFPWACWAQQQPLRVQSCWQAGGSPFAATHAYRPWAGSQGPSGGRARRHTRDGVGEGLR